MKQRLGFSNFRLHRQKDNKAKKVVISAHGGYASGNGFFKVPEGINIHFYCPHGHALKVAAGVWAFLTPKGGKTYDIARTASGGQLVHNYGLTWFENSGNIEKGLEQPGADAWNVVTVGKGKQGTLEDVVKQLQRKGSYTDIHCSFCRVDVDLDMAHTEYKDPKTETKPVAHPFVSYTPGETKTSGMHSKPKREWASWEDV